jgi:hypothetical protein
MPRQVVIFQNDEGGVSILVAAPECLQSYTLEEIAIKDVPAGKPFKIVYDTDLPDDHTFRDAWEVDPSILTDGVGNENNLFPPRGES